MFGSPVYCLRSHAMSDLPAEYIKNRVDDQIAWYDGKASFNKKRFHFLLVTVIVAGGLVPVCTLIGNIVGADYKPPMQVLIASLGALVAILGSVVAVMRYQEQWLQYRSTSESLKYEKFMYLNSAGHYDVENSFKLFVERIEGLMGRERVQWGNRGSNQQPSLMPETRSGGGSDNAAFGDKARN